MRTSGLATFLTITLPWVILCCQTVRADRLYGNASLSYERIIRKNEETLQDDLTRELLIVNYEDALFTKNLLRLTANLNRREFAFSDYHEFIPIYSLNLTSYGYAFDIRYSPYKRRGLQIDANEATDVFYRDWRITANINYVDWPAFSLIYTRLRGFDRADVPTYDSYNRNFVMESSYNYGVLSLRANYNNLRQVNKVVTTQQAITETFSSTVGLSQTISDIAYVNTTYNYYDTRRTSDEIRDQQSNTHTVSSMISLSAIPHFSLNAGFSGRFTNARQRGQLLEDDNQNLSVRAEYTPTAYLSFQAGKGYQISSRDGDHDIVEYVTLGATLTRYFRQGVDTRFTYDRTVFQQSLRLGTVRDTAGNVISTFDRGGYALDTYNASLNFVPMRYVKTYLDVTLSRDSDPVDPRRRYQLTRSLDARVNLSRQMEGRFTFTTLYEGDKLRLDKTFSETYNAGMTYVPLSSFSINVTYIYATYSGVVASRSSSLTGYISYSFRRAFTFYVSVNRRFEKRQRPVPEPDGLEETETRPGAINSQILIYLSSRSTLALSYLQSKISNELGQQLINESIQGVLTVQI